MWRSIGGKEDDSCCRGEKLGPEKASPRGGCLMYDRKTARRSARAPDHKSKFVLPQSQRGIYMLSWRGFAVWLAAVLAWQATVRAQTVIPQPVLERNGLTRGWRALRSN